MFHLTRSSAAAIVLAALAAGFSGCRQPQVVQPQLPNQTSWSEKWSSALSSWSGQSRNQTPSAQPEVPGPKADEQMATAQLLERQGDIDRAIDVYEQILRKDKRRADVHHRVALFYDLKGQPEPALKHYQQALKKNPEDAELLCDLGYHHYLADQPKEAEAALRRAIEQRALSARAHNNLALVLARAGRYDEALAEFNRAGNKPAAAHVNLAYALIWEERFEEASQQIDLALAADPNSKPAQQALASLGKIVSAVQKAEETSVMQVGYEEQPEAAEAAQ